MPLATDQDDTQVLDFDSPHSGCGDVFMGGETLPLDCGETQPVDSYDEQLEGFQDWGKTQLIDEFEETEVLRDDDEDGGESERTELVANEEGLVCDFGGEVESGVRTKYTDLVDPDASTDEEDGCGIDEPECLRKNFVAVPVATLQSSGFVDDRSITCVQFGKQTESSNLAEGNFNAHNHEKTENSHTGMKASWMETTPCSASDLNIVGTKKDEIVLDHEAENSFRLTEGYSRDYFLYQDEETKIGSELNKEKLLSQSPLRCNQAAAGLSYISSQEPGVQSQAIALSVVDKFLSINNEGLSPEINNENLDTVISLPISSVKKAQCFVRKSDKSTAGKVQVYDWIDSLEDEGGGDLFSRKKNSFFYCKRSKQISRELPSEVILGGSEMIIGADNKISTKGTKSRPCQKLASSAKSKKNPYNALKEQTNTETMGQFEKSVHISDEGVYNCGPDTQMAVEAIQALGHSSPVHFELTNLQSKRGKVTNTSTKIKKTNRTCLRNSPTRKRSNKSEGIMTRSKQKSSITKSRRKSCNSSKKQSTKLGTKMVLEDGTAEITAKMTAEISNENCIGVISVNNGDYAVSIIGETMKNMVDKELENPPIPVTLCKQPSVGVKCIVGTSEMYTSPVAHRTRRSKATELLSLHKTLSNDPCKDTSRINLRSRRTAETEDEFVSNTLAVPKVNNNGCNISLNGTINSDYGFSGLADAVEEEKVHVEETGASHDRDVYRESKRTKMKNIDTENKKGDRKINYHSNSVDVIAPTVLKSTIQKNKRKVFIRSFAEILDTVKRRKRSVSSSSKFEFDVIPSNAGKMRNESGIRTRPSLLSDILKPYFANDEHFKVHLSSKPASDGTANTYSVSSVKQGVNNDNLETSKESERSENTKPEGSPNAIRQSGLPCSPTAGRNAVSLVCNSQDTSRISFRKSLSRSPISRELIRLEASYTSPSKLDVVRRRKDMACFQVCFSNHLSQDVIKQQKKILKRLGIQDVSSSFEATHFIADKFMRTRNMLEAMAMGKPVVTPMWLESCGQASSYIDEKNYILRDARKEKEIGFSMPVSLARACQHPLLQGKRVFITRNAKPNQELISSLVMVAGGQPLKRIELTITEEDKLADNLLILSGEEDFAVCAPLLEKGAVVFSSELLLNGIVIQKLEFERHQLFLNQVKRSH